MKHYDHPAIVQKNLSRALADALGCGLALAAFSCLITYAFPYRIAAFVPLTAAAFIIGSSITGSLKPSVTLRMNFSVRQLTFYIVAIQMGFLGGMYYRGSFGMPVLPAVFNNFVWVAACIGMMEELVFRGFIQGRLNAINPALAIVLAAFAHASYKACLFLSPAAEYHYSITLFYTWSFAAFISIGLLRYFSGSIMAAVIVHVVFDLLVYAESLQAPWWVW